MKAEHKEAIDRARMHGVLPSVLANELMVHDLVDASLFELRNIKAPYSKLNEGQQQEVIDRITEKVKDVVQTAVAIISSRNVITIPCKMKQIQVTEKTLTVTSLVDAKDPSRHGLTDSAGHLCLLVLAPDDYAEGLDFIQPDRDQSDLPLHVSELTGSLFERSEAQAQPATLEEDALYEKAVDFIVKSQRATISSIQRELKISHDRAARIIDALELAGMVSPIDHTGDRVVLVQEKPAGPDDVVDAEFVQDSTESLPDTGELDALVTAADPDQFGDMSYSDAQQIVVLHGNSVTNGWLQRRIGLDADQATTLLLRLVDDNVIALETEADLSIDNTYTVVANLADLTLE
ncbi:DNA translocase FtsK [Pseudomonas syringae]|nr:DNA translocase FtsK [Pseudomonas syringae]